MMQRKRLLQLSWSVTWTKNPMGTDHCQRGKHKPVVISMPLHKLSQLRSILRVPKSTRATRTIATIITTTVTEKIAIRNTLLRSGSLMLQSSRIGIERTANSSDHGLLEHDDILRQSVNTSAVRFPMKVRLTHPMVETVGQYPGSCEIELDM